METVRIRVNKEIELPDPVKLALYAKSPELGPRLLFFSGGTAIRDLSRALISRTHNSIHVITPFDSGGSSAVLRRAFGMPAVGDVRNRIMALADQTLTGNPEIYDLFAYRLVKDRPRPELVRELESMAAGEHELVSKIPDPMRDIVRNHLSRFIEYMPEDFDLRGASIGNLVLTAGYLDNHRRMDPVIYIFSKLVAACGVVRPVVDADLQLVSELESGERIIGQHLITAKEAPPIATRIKDVRLINEKDPETPVAPPITEEMKMLISRAELICFPMGSFYSSIIANVLPSGVGLAAAANHCPKVFIPNTTTDPECYGMTLGDQVETLLKYLRADAPDEIDARDALDFVLLDEDGSRYQGGVNEKRIKALGAEPVRYPLVTTGSAPFIDAQRLAAVLLSLV